MSEEATLDEFAESTDAENEEIESRKSRFWGKIPEGWELVTGSDVYNVNPNPKPDSEPNTYIEMDALDTELPWPKYFGKRNASEYSGKTFTHGDTLFARITPCTENGKAALVPEIETTIGIGSTEYAVLSPKTGQINSWLLYYLAKSYPVHNYAVSRMRGSTGRQRVPFSVFRRELDIALPPFVEQRKIASVLYTVDRLIKNANEIETQLQRVKKGTAQKLFTYGINNEDTQSHHIGDFPQSWEFNKVSTLADIERGNTPRTSHDEYYGGDITWVTPDDLSDLNEDGNGKYISDSGRKLTPEGVESSSLTIVKPDSIMFTSRSYGIGRTAICTVPAATNQGITAFECETSLDTEFFYYYLNYIMDYVVSISGGSTFPEISKSATGKIDVPVPDINEQEEIASILSQFDEQILHNREVLNQIKRLKRSLQQDLLSGTVRTTDTNIEVPDEIAQHG